MIPMMRVTISAAVFSVLAMLFTSGGPALAQQLEPRAYSPAPIGTHFLGIGYTYQSGNAVLDPSVPIENVHARIQTVVPYYGQAFGLFGRQASVTIVTPFAHADVYGDIQDEHKSIDRTGLGDPALRFAMNLMGGPALTPREFFRHKPETTLGTSLTVVAPFGQYDQAKLINLGANRWAFKPELGFSQPVGDWTYEVYAGVWLFTDNDRFYGGQVRKQDPLAAYQAHVGYNFTPRAWVALDFTYYSGGATTVGGQSNNDRQDNTRTGLTIALPVTSYQSLKLSWARGVSTRIGSNFETIGVAWQWIWF
jgi:hypothetical protein